MGTTAFFDAIIGYPFHKLELKVHNQDNCIGKAKINSTSTSNIICQNFENSIQRFHILFTVLSFSKEREISSSQMAGCYLSLKNEKNKIS